MMAIPKSSMSPLEHQQFQRLKVNRIAVIQDLKVDHILNYLLSKSVLNHKDLIEIEKCRTTTEKSKRLLDILPTKGRASNWYKHFRAALLNPSVNDLKIKSKYQILVEFLDNTIIDQMSHPIKIKHQTSKTEAEQMSSLHKYKPLPSIANNASRPPTIAGRKSKDIPTQTTDSPREQKESYKTAERVKPANSKHRISQSGDSQLSEDADLQQSPDRWSIHSLKGTKIPYVVKYWEKDPENFSSVLEVPMTEVMKLEESNHAAEVALGEQQRDAADRMKQLEILYFLWKNQGMADETVLCTSSAVLDIIQDTPSHHLHFKYFEHLKKNYDMEIAMEIVYSYDEVAQWLAGANDTKTYEQFTDIGINLINFLYEFGESDLVWLVVETIESFISESTDMWLMRFNFSVKCIEISNKYFDLERAEKYISKANALRDQIGKAMSSFGSETLDCSELFRETSITKRESGNFGIAYTLAQKAMQEVELENRLIVISALCTASRAYANQWKLLRAEDLAVEALQQAKYLTGVYHPVYLNALQNYTAFSSQHRQKTFGVETSVAALRIARTLYGYDSIQVAHAYAGHANALIAAGQFDKMIFFDSAEKAYAIAVERFPLSHPLLLPFLDTLVRSLIARSGLETNEKERQGLLVWADGEAKRSANIAEAKFGEVSHQCAVAHQLQADVFAQCERNTDATAYYNMALNTMSLNLGTKHGYVMRIKAKLAVLAKKAGDITKAKTMLREVIENFDSAAYYMEWYNEAYEELISCYEQTDSQEVVKEWRSKHMGWKWISEDNSREISWRELHSTPEGYDSFLEKFELWRSRVKKVRHHIEQQKLNAEAPSSI